MKGRQTSPEQPSCPPSANLVHEEVVEQRKIKDKNLLKYYIQFTERQTTKHWLGHLRPRFQKSSQIDISLLSEKLTQHTHSKPNSADCFAVSTYFITVTISFPLGPQIPIRIPRETDLTTTVLKDKKLLLTIYSMPLALDSEQEPLSWNHHRTRAGVQVGSEVRAQGSHKGVNASSTAGRGEGGRKGTWCQDQTINTCIFPTSLYMTPPRRFCPPLLAVSI